MDKYKVQRIGLAGRSAVVAETVLNSLASEGYRVIQVLPAGTADAFVILEKLDNFLVPEKPASEKKRGPGRPKKEEEAPAEE